jgi:hypothetical protein
MTGNLADESPLESVSVGCVRCKIELGLANLFVKVHSILTSARLRRKAESSLLPVQICVILCEDLTRLRNYPNLDLKSALEPRYM